MSKITDAFMRNELRKLRPYTFVILHRTPKRKGPGADKVVWEHGRRNFELRRDKILPIVCQVERDDSDIAGICIFATKPDKTKRIMDKDPAIKGGIFTYETHLVWGFPEDALS